MTQEVFELLLLGGASIMVTAFLTKILRRMLERM